MNEARGKESLHIPYGWTVLAGGGWHRTPGAEARVRRRARTEVVCIVKMRKAALLEMGLLVENYHNGLRSLYIDSPKLLLC